MRPTELQFKDPAHFTPNFYYSNAHYNGNVIGYRGNQIHSIKGSIPKEDRFKLPSGEAYAVGPHTYYPEVSFKRMNRARCSSVFSKKPGNLYLFKNSNECQMIGQQIKHMPQLVRTSKQSLQGVVKTMNKQTDSITINDIYKLTMASEVSN